MEGTEVLVAGRVGRAPPLRPPGGFPDLFALGERGGAKAEGRGWLLFPRKAASRARFDLIISSIEGMWEVALGAEGEGEGRATGSGSRRSWLCSTAE